MVRTSWPRCSNALAKQFEMALLASRRRIGIANALFKPCADTGQPVMSAVCARAARQEEGAGRKAPRLLQTPFSMLSSGSTSTSPRRQIRPSHWRNTGFIDCPRHGFGIPHNLVTPLDKAQFKEFMFGAGIFEPLDSTLGITLKMAPLSRIKRRFHDEPLHHTDSHRRISSMLGQWAVYSIER